MCLLDYEDCDAWETVVLDFDNNTWKCTLFAQPLKEEADDGVNDTKNFHANADQWNKNPSSINKNLPSNSYRKKFQKQQHSYVQTKFLSAWQSPNNSPRYTVGFLQRRAKVLTRKIAATAAAAHRSDRILYVLHYHHPIPSSGHLDVLLNQLLISYLPPEMFDLVVVTPNEEVLPIKYSSDGHVSSSSSSSLANPFVPKDDKSKLGSNSYMSISLAQTKFPGYKGYLLVNDDAVLRFWDMMDSQNIWFAYRPWVTEPFIMEDLNHPSQQIKRGEDKIYDIDDKLYADWNWWNKDSGSTTWPPPHLARSNFDAALAALNELCEIIVTKGTHKSLFTGLPAETLCQQRTNNSILAPYVHGRADVFYVPNDEPFGPAFIKSLSVFGSHDVFLEIAVPMLYQLVVPNTPIWRKDPLWGLSAPYCQRAQSGGQIAFEPVHSRKGQIHPDLQCTVLHPLKFSRIEYVEYWRQVVREECGVSCDDYSKIPWRVIL
jgi:hypothetical protein